MKMRPEAGILRGVDHDRLADRRDHALGGGRVGRRIFAAEHQVLAKRELGLPAAFEQIGIEVEDVGLVVHCAPGM
jgi:hypothetical protein